MIDVTNMLFHHGKKNKTAKVAKFDVQGIFLVEKKMLTLLINVLFVFLTFYIID